MKKLSFVIFLSVLTVFAQAQTLRVHLKNGTSVYYSSEQVDYVDFVEETAEPNPGTDANPENTRHIKEPYFSETVELMGLLWRLAGSSEYCQCEVATVAESADSYFAPMKNHQAETLAKRYSQQNIVYDAVTAYANQLIFDQSGELIFDPNYQEGSNNGLDRWSNTQKTEMLAAINDFYKASNFHDWFASTAKEQQEAIASFKSICSVDYEWFDKYYGKNDKVASRIILSFMAGRNNYGISLTRKDGTFQLSPIYGCLSQVRGEVWFGANMDLIIHEFSHP